MKINKTAVYCVLSSILTLLLWQTAPVVYHIGKIVYKTGSLTTTDNVLIYILNQLNAPQPQK